MNLIKPLKKRDTMKLVKLMLVNMLFVCAMVGAIAQPKQIVCKAFKDGTLLLDANKAFCKTDSGYTMPKLLPLLDGNDFPLGQFIAPISDSGGKLVWNLNVSKKGKYLLTLEFSHPSFGNGFIVRVNNQVMNGYVPGTRNSMALIELGSIILEKGTSTLELVNQTSNNNQFMSVSALFLRPESLAGMNKPTIKSLILSRKSKLDLINELKMPKVFGDHMVLQRQKKVPIWGIAKPKEEVVVKLDGQLKMTTADNEGHWSLFLDSMEAGGPFVLEIKTTNKIINYGDVMIGDVWFGSGQSNMEVSVKYAPNKKDTTNKNPYECDMATKEFLENGCDSLVRISAITRDHITSPKWMILSKENCLEVPALMTCMAVLQKRKLKIPIGIIVRCESSSSSCIWVSRDVIELDTTIQNQLKNYDRYQFPKLKTVYKAKQIEWDNLVATAKAVGKKLPLRPVYPDSAGEFSLFYIDSHGGKMEHYGANYQQIAAVMPYAIKGIVWDQGENKTGMAGVDQLAIMPALVRSWRKDWMDNQLPFIYIRKNQHPASLPARMETLGNIAQVDNRGLGQINHPPDKLAYADRLVEQIEKLTTDK